MREYDQHKTQHCHMTIVEAKDLKKGEYDDFFKSGFQIQSLHIEISLEK